MDNKQAQSKFIAVILMPEQERGESKPKDLGLMNSWDILNAFVGGDMFEHVVKKGGLRESEARYVAQNLFLGQRPIVCLLDNNRIMQNKDSSFAKAKGQPTVLTKTSTSGDWEH